MNISFLTEKLAYSQICGTKVGPSYNKNGVKGPQLPIDGTVSRDFMINLEKWFKDQNKLHKRYIFQMISNGIEQFKAKPTMVDLTIPEDG